MFQIQVHGSDLTSFYEQVPKEILPTEYGGNSGSVAENWGMIENGFIVRIIQKAKLQYFTSVHFIA
jgi:hypothetical protein